MENGRNYEGYKNLAIKVIKTATKNLQKKRDEQFYISLNWFADRERLTRLPFEDLCYGLSSDPDAIRREIVNHPKVKRNLSEDEIQYILNN